MEEQIKEKSVSIAKTSPKSKMYHFAIFLGAAGVLVAGGIWRGGRHDDAGQDAGITALETLRKEVSGLQSALKKSELQSINDVIIGITEKTAGAVVSIKPFDSEPLRQIPSYGRGPQLYEMPPAPDLLPGISGLIVDSGGYVVTSAGVTGLDPPFRIVRDGATHIADLKSVNRDSYIAVLKIRDVPAGLPSLEAIATHNLTPGDWMIRHGRSPAGGQSRSIAVLESVRTTSGGRTIGMLDSEGPPEMDGATVMNESGEIVGIYVKPPGRPGILVPIQTALEFASISKSENPGPQSWSGLELQDLGAGLREYFSVEGGILVTQVEAGSPASRAGMRPLDLIEKINSESVASAADAASLIANAPPGTSLQLEIRRNGRLQVLVLLAGDLPVAFRDARLPPEEPAMLIKLTPLAAGTDGLLITEIKPRALANRIGVQAGDVILSVNKTRLRTVDQFSRIQSRLPSDGGQLWEIQRRNRVFFIAVEERPGLL